MRHPVDNRRLALHLCCLYWSLVAALADVRLDAATAVPVLMPSMSEPDDVTYDKQPDRLTDNGSAASKLLNLDDHVVSSHVLCAVCHRSATHEHQHHRSIYLEMESSTDVDGLSPNRAGFTSTSVQSSSLATILSSDQRRTEVENDDGITVIGRSLASETIQPEVDDTTRGNRRLDQPSPDQHDVAVTDSASRVLETTQERGESSTTASLDEHRVSTDNRTRQFGSIALNASNPVQVHTEPEDQSDGGDTRRMTVVLPTALGVAVLLLVAGGAAVYRFHLRGRRRKVYFGGGPHGTTAAMAKDFAEDRGVRGPVLLPDEIEMQIARSSLRARKALVLTSDVTGAADDDDGSTSIDRAPESPQTQPPPPYRSQTPYLPDVIVQNSHAR